VKFDKSRLLQAKLGDVLTNNAVDHSIDLDVTCLQIFLFDSLLCSWFMASYLSCIVHFRLLLLF